MGKAGNNRRPGSTLTECSEANFVGHVCQLVDGSTNTAGEKHLKGRLIIVQSSIDHVHFLKMPAATNWRGWIIKIYNKGTTSAKDLVVLPKSGTGGVCTIVAGSAVDVISDGTNWMACLAGSSADAYASDSSGA